MSNHINDDDFATFTDELLASIGVPSTVPEPCVCASRSDLAVWFFQFGRACRAARLGKKS